jgi:hypothetical protein
VPGGALSSEDGAWHASSPGFFLPVKALSKIVRAKVRDRMYRAGLLAEIPAEVWTQDWNVHCQAVPHAEASIEYLAPYVFKPVLSLSKGWRSPITASLRSRTGRYASPTASPAVPAGAP